MSTLEITSAGGSCVLGENGRWESLRSPDVREWLWSRPDSRRATALPGDTFVDIGGVEECFPTISGNPAHGLPDHGALWTAEWVTQASPTRNRVVHTVSTGKSSLRRETRATSEGIAIDYELDAPAGTRFVWAWHALVTPLPGLTVTAGGSPEPLVVVGEDDGTAEFRCLPGVSDAVVGDANGELRLSLRCAEAPVSLGVWDNRGGYSWDNTDPYRSLGVEPMLGQTADPAVEPELAVTMPASNKLRWQLALQFLPTSTSPTSTLLNIKENS